jgi:hypothetical protein
MPAFRDRTLKEVMKTKSEHGDGPFSNITHVLKRGDQDTGIERKIR